MFARRRAVNEPSSFTAGRGGSIGAARPLLIFSC
jgi:hypothetical protein